MEKENRLVVSSFPTASSQRIAFQFSYGTFYMRKRRNSKPEAISTYLKILDEIISLTRRPPKRKGTFDFKVLPYDQPTWVGDMEKFFTGMSVGLKMNNGESIVTVTMDMSAPLSKDQKADWFDNRILELFSLIVSGHSNSFTVEMDDQGRFIFIQKIVD